MNNISEIDQQVIQQKIYDGICKLSAERNEKIKQQVGREFRHGPDFADYLLNFPEKKQEILLKIGVPQDKLPKFLDFLDKQVWPASYNCDIGQIFAVLDGVKPMWYGSIEHVQTELGRFIKRNVKKLGLVSATVGKEALIGKPENVKKAKAGLIRTQKKGKADEQYNRVMGLALGYPPEDVEEFIKMIHSTTVIQSTIVIKL